MNIFFIENYKKIKKNIVLSIPILFIIATPIHFLYELTGKIAIVGAITPVNESIAEHFKLATMPVILWWIISYYILKRKVDINFKKWIFLVGLLMQEVMKIYPIQEMKSLKLLYMCNRK